MKFHEFVLGHLCSVLFDIAFTVNLRPTIYLLTCMILRNIEYMNK